SYVREHFRDKLVFAVSCTTRTPRPGEIEGETYYFLTPEAFQEKVEKGEFLEWAEFGGHKYGTLKSEIITPLRHGKVVLREVELQGVEALRALIPKQNRTVVFVDGGSWELLA